LDDLIAQAYINRIKNGGRLSDNIETELFMFAENVPHIKDDKLFADFLATILNNPDKISEGTISNIISSGLILNEDYVFASLDAKVAKRLTRVFKENKNNVNLTLKILNVLESLREAEDNLYSVGTEEAETAIQTIYNDSNNYFIKEYAGLINKESAKELSVDKKRQILTQEWDTISDPKNYYRFYQDKTKLEKKPINQFSNEEINEMFGRYMDFFPNYFAKQDYREAKKRYDDKKLRQEYQVLPPLTQYNKKDDDPKKLEADFSYRRISGDYGAIYRLENPIAYFELGENKKPSLLNLDEILRQEGFSKDNIADSEYEKITLTYKTLISLHLLKAIEDEFDIELNQFNIREQVQFVNFLSSKTVNEVEEVKRFIKQGKNKRAKDNRIRVFLSLEQGEEMGDKIVSIGKNLNTESADSIFGKYSRLIQLAKQGKKELENVFKESRELSAEELEKISQNLLKRANQLLINFADRITGGDTEQLDQKNVIKELENYKSDLILTASVYKSLAKEKDFKIDDLRGVSFEVSTADEVINNDPELMKIVGEAYMDTYRWNKNRAVPFDNIKNKMAQKHEVDQAEEEKAYTIWQMLEMYRKNYDYNKKIQKELLENFIEVLLKGSANTTFYTIKKNGKLLAFNRFDKKEDSPTYFGSCNVDPSIQNSAIGNALLQTSLEEQSRYANLEAFSDATSPSSSMYVERYGFTADGIVPNSLETDIPYFTIILNKQGRLETNKKQKRLSLEEIKKQYNGNNYTVGQKTIILKFDLRDELDEFKKNMTELLLEKDDHNNIISGQNLDNKYVITRYINDRESGEKKTVYMVLEKS
jgi:predicted GNAT family N-acyltransferase